MKMNDKVKNTYKSSFITKLDYLLQKKRNSPNYRSVSNYCLIKNYQSIVQVRAPSTAFLTSSPVAIPAVLTVTAPGATVKAAY